MRTLTGVCLLMGVGLVAACASTSEIGPAPAVDVHSYDTKALSRVRGSLQVGEEDFRAPYRALLSEADAVLDDTFATVIDKSQPAPSGDWHDYYSTAPYWWPDTTKPGGLPYVRRDGQRNPESQHLDESSLDAVLHGVPTLAWAWYFSGDEAYADKAGEVLRMWFVDEATRMNPHLNHAQAVPGRADGRKYGIIEGQHFYEFVDALALLKASGALNAEAWEAVDDWFGDYLTWLRESDFGRAEAATENNHATAYDAQVAAIALYLGRDEVAREVLAAVPTRRIDTQIAPDGRQPEELDRTRSFHYSVYNLYHLFNAATLAPHVGVDLFGYVDEDGRSLRAALDYLVPFMTDQEAWPHPQLRKEWTLADTRAAMLLRRASFAYGDTHYEEVRRSATEVDSDERYLLLYPYVE